MSRESKFIIHALSPEDFSELVSLNSKYHHRYPKAELIDEDMLRSPNYDDGKNIICAFDNSGKLAGYIPLAPHLTQDTTIPNLIWSNMVVEPTIASNRNLRDILLKQAIDRAKEITSSASSHSTRLCFQHHISEVEALEYVIAKGASYGDSVLRMIRNLSGDIELISPSSTIKIRDWKIETEADVEVYVAARNEAFPGMPITVEDWSHFLSFEVGDNGTTIAAFDGDKLVGAVSAYWIEDDNRRLGEAAGWTENVFVLAPWRGKGIADSMISMACAYLKEHGLKKAQLDPGASNQRAVHVYKRLGYEIVDESRQYWLEI